MPRIIALAGLAGSGKSTVASILTSGWGFQVVKFADPLKAMLRALGIDQADLELAERKGLPSKLLSGRSPRYAMQTLGTEWGRQLIGENIWAEAWKRRARELALDGKAIVCDDCRFDNEVSAVRDLGGEVWSIVRPGVRSGPHPSEQNFAARHAEVRLVNSGSLDDLLVRVTDLMGRY